MRKITFILLLAAILVSCSSVLLTGRKQLLLVSDSDVLASSLQSYKQYIDSVPPSTNKTQTALVKKVGGKIATAVEAYLKANGMEAEIANYQWEFNLVKDATQNAFCMPGGKVVVYEGILPITKTEAGLAVVMGHEIAHVVAKHSAERMSQQMIAQYGASVTDILTANKSATTRTAVNAIYGLGAQYGVLLPYSRTQELEADRLGLIFMAMAGYDPNQALSFWQRMSANNTEGTAGSTADLLQLISRKYMSTHPTDATRIAKIQQNLPEALENYKK